MTQKFSFTLFADYFQFYLQDEKANGDLSGNWNDEATERLLAVGTGVIGIGTARNMNVPVEVEISDDEPDDDLSEWDQVNECTLGTPTGCIVIAGSTDYFPDAARIKVESGSYRVRLFYGDLSSVSNDGLNGSDHYRLVLWRAPPGPVQVLKQRTSQRG